MRALTRSWMAAVAFLFLVFFAPRAYADGGPGGNASPDEMIAFAQNALRQGDIETALTRFAAAQLAYPQSKDIRNEIENVVEQGLPDQFNVSLLSSLPVMVTPLADGLGFLVVPQPYLITQMQEPQHSWDFVKISYVYIPTGPSASHRLRQLCCVHYTTPDDTALAGRFGGLLALAHRTLVTETGQEAVNGTAPFHVWLCREGHSGGEQWRSHIYFYDLDAPRSSIEWIREIVHEYSHLALPAIGGYQAPEYWANGYLGERLLVRWFQRIPGGAALVEKVWGNFSGAANFDRLLIAPALAEYQKAGYSSKWLSRTDEPGMRYLIGMVLAEDDKHGAHALGKAFQQLPRFRETRAADIAAALHVSASARLAGH